VLNHDVLAEAVDQFRWDGDTILQAQRATTLILMEEWDVFTAIKDTPHEIQAKFAIKEIKARAQRSLEAADRDGFLDPRALFNALQARLTQEWARLGLEGSDDPRKMEEALEKILALKPDLLPRAVQETLARRTVEVEAASLPTMLMEKNEAVGARLNLYGVFPTDLNRWERAFAEILDNDLTGTVLWWHRNPDRKPFSVCVPVPGQPQFFPDFLVGVAGRPSTDHVLMIETKGQINDSKGNSVAKTQVKHPRYGRALMVHWQDEKEWRTVEFDRASGQNQLDRRFRIEDLKTYG
jgi:sulfur transfer complex TusBCD TusB component (DsrH family)